MSDAFSRILDWLTFFADGTNPLYYVAMYGSAILTLAYCVRRAVKTDNPEARTAWLFFSPFLAAGAGFAGMFLGLILLIPLMLVSGVFVVWMLIVSARSELDTYKPGSINNPYHVHIRH